MRSKREAAPAVGSTTKARSPGITAFALIVYAGAAGAQTGIWHRASSRGFLPWVGLVSYSLYIWHEPLLLTLAGRGLLPEQAAASFIPTTAVLLVLSLFVAWVSYWVIEHPASHLRFFFGDAPSGQLQAERRSAP